jgi:NADH-quinone oxidoreductase subunit M
LGNFIGEFLVLVGVYQVSVPVTVVASLGLVAATVYSLWIIQRVFHGADTPHMSVRDLSPRESAVMAALIAAIVWLGLYPQPVLNTAQPLLNHLQSTVHFEERLP